jgi:hypothetical protein
MKINFQTMNKIDQLILSSNESIINKITLKQISINELSRNINDIPNVLKFIFEETITGLIKNHKE